MSTSPISIVIQFLSIDVTFDSEFANQDTASHLVERLVERDEY